MSPYTIKYLPSAETRGALPDPQRNDLDPDHHLWKNGRLWWIAFTVHTADWKKKRLRFSLGTSNIRQARLRRDAVLRHHEEAGEVELSLRYARLGT